MMCSRALPFINARVMLWEKRERHCIGRKEGNVHYLRFSGEHIQNGSKTIKMLASDEGRKELFYLMTHSTHFIYGYMASDIW